MNMVSSRNWLRINIKSTAPLLVLLVVCHFLSSNCSFFNYDTFNNTSYSISLDKDGYSVGDSIIMTFEIQGDAEVRFYENIENTLEVWLVFRVPYDENNTVVTAEGIFSEEIETRLHGGINTYKLEEHKPLALRFTGYLSESEEKDAYVIVFPQLNKRFSIDKDNYSSALSLEIQGHLMPISPGAGDSLEDYLQPIRIIISQK